MAFLFFVFLILVVCVLGLAWISKTRIFAGKLEPAFVGALVGAAGTIFAACIAYTAASQNIEIARLAEQKAEKQGIESDKMQKRYAREQAARELQALRDLQTFVDRILAGFAEATDGIGPQDYFAKMMDAERNGSIVGYSGGAPDPFRVRISDLVQRLFAIKNPVIQANAMAQNPQRPRAEIDEERNRLNAAIRDRIREVVQLKAEVVADIDRRVHAATAAE